MSTFYNREGEKAIKKISKTFRVLLVTGPRQTGKTTLLKSLMPENMEYVSLDDLSLREQAKTEPKLFLEEHPFPLFIDEVQYAPELFPYIKMKVDEKNEKGMYWLSGSQQFHLMKGVSESLAGRVGIVNLNSFTYAEISKNIENKTVFEPTKKPDKKPLININELFEVIFRGGMPYLYSESEVDREAFFDSYINTYIERDVRELTNIGNSGAFRRFIVSVASRTGEQLNYTSLAEDANISVPTAKNWLNILVTSGIVYLLEPYLKTNLQRLTHTPKIVFMDTGLAAYLSGWRNARDLQLSAYSGHFLETFITSEIIKTYNASGINPNISYYRDKEKNEIDLLFYRNNEVIPFEIKKTASPVKADLKNFAKIRIKHKTVAGGGLICFCDSVMRLTEDYYAIPIGSVIL